MQVDGVVYVEVVHCVVDLCVENVASMARVSDGVASAGTPSPRDRTHRDAEPHVLLCIHVVPPRRNRFEMSVRAAAEELGRRLACTLSAAPGLAGGEGRASRAARSDHCEPQCHPLPSSAVCSGVQCSN